MTVLAAALQMLLLASPPVARGDEFAVPFSAAICAVQYRTDLLVAEANEASAAGASEEARGLRAVRRAAEAVGMYGLFLAHLVSAKLERVPCTSHQVMRVARCLNVEFTSIDSGSVVWAKKREGCDPSTLGSFGRVVEFIETQRVPHTPRDQPPEATPARTEL